VFSKTFLRFQGKYCLNYQGVFSKPKLNSKHFMNRYKKHLRILFSLNCIFPIGTHGADCIQGELNIYWLFAGLSAPECKWIRR